MKLRDKAKVDAAQTGDNSKYSVYKKLRNEVCMKLRNAKTHYYNEKFNESNDSKEMWRISTSVLGKFRTNFPSQIMFDQKLLSRPIDIATEMNHFFLNKIKKLKGIRIDDDPLTELKEYLSVKNIAKNQFKFKEVSKQKMQEILLLLKGKKSCGPDWICGYSLKIASKVIQEEIRYLINLSILSGTFSVQWKKSKVLPAFKNKGSNSDAKNYCPLSNLSEVSKLIELAVYYHIFEYLSSKDLIHPHHHGFLKYHSTATALQQLVDLWVPAADKENLSASLLLDLSAGFDVINHDILKLKLSEYGLDETALSWFNSYMSGREQCVQVESRFSSFLAVPWGVPQGSILGPLLFIIYVNELPEVIGSLQDSLDQGSVVVYADDNTPTVADSDVGTLIQKAQLTAAKTTFWFKRNDMVVSGEKTKLMILGTHLNRKLQLENAKDLRMEVEVDGNKVYPSKSEKLLGVICNDNINWKNQLYGDDDNKGLIRELSQRIGVLTALRRYLTYDKFRQVVAGIFTSKLLYCINVWTGVWDIPGQQGDFNNVSISKHNMHNLQVLQNKTLRLMSNSNKYTPTSQMLQMTNSMSVHQLGALHILLQVYKTHQTRRPVYHYKRLFNNCQSGTNMRSDANLQSRVEFSLSTGRSSFFYQGAKLWTSLPMQIKTCQTASGFKRRCTEWIKSNIKIKPQVSGLN